MDRSERGAGLSERGGGSCGWGLGASDRSIIIGIKWRVAAGRRQAPTQALFVTGSHSVSQYVNASLSMTVL